MTNLAVNILVNHIVVINHLNSLNTKKINKCKTRGRQRGCPHTKRKRTTEEEEKEEEEKERKEAQGIVFQASLNQANQNIIASNVLTERSMKDSRKTTVESHIFSYNKLIMDIEERMDNAEKGSKKMPRLKKPEKRRRKTRVIED